VSLRDVLWEEGDKPSINEIETRKYFYSSTASAPVGDISYAVGNSTFLEDQITNLKQEQYVYQVYSYGNGEISNFGWTENRERDRYLEQGLESFDIFDD
jgi:hypothetical protein